MDAVWPIGGTRQHRRAVGIEDWHSFSLLARPWAEEGQGTQPQFTAQLRVVPVQELPDHLLCQAPDQPIEQRATINASAKHEAGKRPRWGQGEEHGCRTRDAKFFGEAVPSDPAILVDDRFCALRCAPGILVELVRNIPPLRESIAQLIEEMARSNRRGTGSTSDERLIGMAQRREIDAVIGCQA